MFARMWIDCRLLTSWLSTQKKSTWLSSNIRVTGTLRASRPKWAITNVASDRIACSMALANSGRSPRFFVFPVGVLGDDPPGAVVVVTKRADLGLLCGRSSALERLCFGQTRK